jgi:plasmid stabilization system protein ParE
MPPRAVELHPEAIEDIRGAREWYASRSFNEIEDGLRKIAKRPEAWPVFLHGTRRFLLRRYPYSLVYRLKPSIIEVVAVAHGKRRPGFWRER